jgi:outer membrane receptor protein involved in Fe transport
VNNDFVKDLKQEKIFSAEVGYRLQTSWLKANLNAYYSLLDDVTEQSMYYMDDKHSFTYVSLTGIQKEYYGVELGMNFRITEWLNLKALGTISDAKYINNANVYYMLSEDGKTYSDVCLNKGMREGCTPLTAASLDLSYHAKGWYIDLIGNYYDRIYLYYTPVTRYESHQTKQIIGYGDNPEVVYTNLPDQAKGKGGFMLDASIGKSYNLRNGRRIGFNLMLTNILNNTKLVTGGREQSRTDVDENGESIRTYSFQNSPYKFYANGINGMLMINYYF